MEKMLELRNKKKAQKPNFIRQCANKIVRLPEGWRQPKGMHSKTRRKLASRKKHPSMGYSSPRKVRGLHRKGLQMVTVVKISDLKDIDVKTQGIILQAVGQKRKLELIKKALELKITILNIPKPEQFIQDVKVKIESKKKQDQEKKEKKKESRAKAEKKAQEKEKEEQETVEQTPEEIKETKREAEREKVKLLEAGE
ncbi:MAG: 50S ribosomal protein L32e [archaeon]